VATASRGRLDPVGLVIAAALLLLAGLLVWDAARLPGSTYGIGPAAMPYVIAAGLVALAVGNGILGFVGGFPQREALDGVAVLLILAGLAGLIILIGVGAGFIPAVAILFAATATAMGRRAPLADLAIGVLLGLVTYLMFAKLLGLSLPAGPIENLF
jgi:putative tricarboxylic transport membrane protein